jgi:hypothetical protein
MHELSYSGVMNNYLRKSDPATKHSSGRDISNIALDVLQEMCYKTETTIWHA